MAYTILKGLQLVFTGDLLNCTVAPVVVQDLKSIKKDFSFDWSALFKTPKIQIVKLTIEDNNVIEGLMAYKFAKGFVEIVLIERRLYKKQKIFNDTLKVLFHYACKKSFEIPENEGVVVFTAKTNLVKYYEQELGAHVVFGSRMIISTFNSEKLLNLYYEKKK